MEITDLPYAIEALGFDEESIDIVKHKKYHNKIMRDTFCRRSMLNIEGVGSVFEGLVAGIFGKRELADKTDIDVVYYIPKMNLKVVPMSGFQTVEMEIIVEKDLAIIPCTNFHGYVNLQLIKPIQVLNFLPNSILNKTKITRTHLSQEVNVVKTTQNGPAVTQYLGIGIVPISKVDIVNCLPFKSWPIEANKWANRNKPNKWPSKELIEEIKSQGFTLAPVGHCDCIKKELQWRIGILGETELMLTLNHTQILCYTALKLILKGDIKQIHKDVLSSYHMKNVIFWCVEKDSCQWTKENFEICLKTCIKRLITFIKLNKFPHYFIEDRNLINSMMTSKLKKQIVKAFTKYSNNILAILSLRLFDEVRFLTSFKVDLLECAKQKSIIYKCLEFYAETISLFYLEPNHLWQTYAGHSTEINLKNAQRILSTLNETKRHFICHHIAYAKNMLGLLFYSRYHDTGCLHDISRARKLLMSSLTIEHISLKFRVATFLFMEKDFTNCLNFCSVFLRNPNKYKSTHEKLQHVDKVLTIFKTWVVSSTGNALELKELKEKILAIFYDKCISEKCGDGRILQCNIISSQINSLSEIFNDVSELSDDAFSEKYMNTIILLLFENFTNLVFCDMSFNVPYLASEKWAVPEVIQYELLSVTSCQPEIHIYGIYLDPMLTCLVLTFLCYLKTEKKKQRDEILSKMEKYIDKCSKSAESGKAVSERPHSLPLYRVYNIVAYCCVKAERHQQALKCVLNSLELNRERQNAAYGYVRCVCKILNSLN